MKLTPFVGLLVLVIVVAFPIFGNIGYYPIRLWDESRVAINAYEMYKSGNWIITTFNGEPDMWNTKPPLLIWIQVLFIKLFGLHDLSIRMISPIAALGTCVYIYWFSVKKFKQPWLGLLTCFVLVTSQGYIRLHGTRTGEYDSLMVMFTTMHVLHYFLYLEDSKKKYFYVSVAALTLAVLTKGVAALLFLPALLLYTVFTRKLVHLLKQAHFYFGLVFFIVFVLGYYLLREYYNPGFIEQVRLNELGGRFLETDRTYKGDNLFYYHILTTRTFIRWFVLMLVGIVLGLFSRDPLLKKITTYSMLAGLSYFIVVSLSKTKNEWYDMPCYPFFSIITAIGILIICQGLYKIPYPRTYLNKITIAVFIIAIGWLPYVEIVKENFHPDYQDWSQENDSISFYMRDIVRKKVKIDNLVIAKEGYQADMQWYRLLLKEQGRQIDTADYKNLAPDKNVIVYQKAIKEYISANYKVTTLDSFNTLFVYHLHDRIR